MATQKELDAVMRLLRAAAEVNASSERVNVEVSVNSDRAAVWVSDPVIVMATADPEKPKWEWLFYSDLPAYFSGEIFSEADFIARCEEFIIVIKGFEGRAVGEVAQ